MFIRTSPESRPRRKKHHDLDREESTTSSRRNKSRDRDRERDKDREEKRHRPSRKSSSRKVSSSSITKDSEGRDKERPRVRRSHSSSHTLSTKMAENGVPELERRASTASPYHNNASLNNASRSSLSYPTFSKAHSREAVRPSEVSSTPRVSLDTPAPTDYDGDSPKIARANSAEPQATAGAVPPSPPLTSTEHDLRRAASENSMRRVPEMEGGRKSVDSSTRSQKGHKSSRSSLRNSMKVEDGPDSRSSTPGSRSHRSKSFRRKTSIPDVSTISPSTSPAPPGAESTAASQQASVLTQSTTDSQATSVAPEVKQARKTPAPPPPPQVIPVALSGSSIVDSSPRTPTVHDPVIVIPDYYKDEPVVDVFNIGGFRAPSAAFSQSAFPSMPMPPPPPPPPPMMPTNVEPPRVDYLLQNGGLQRAVPRSFLAAATPNGQPTPAYQQYMSPRIPGPQAASAQAVFTPLHRLLEDYTQVMSKKGSIAVATGYRSVARRLLDRLEAVFARNISTEYCHCILCRANEQYDHEDSAGISWGEILEYVAGRRELPPWPPFIMASDGPGLGITDSCLGRLETPMQKLDIDVPEEYRDHYVRQSKKTQKSVQTWLQNQPEFPSSPPQDVDEETLTFAILTYLEPEQRPLFRALLQGMSTLPQSRAPTPLDQPKSEIVNKTGLALQRLYRLTTPPREAESTLFLLKHPDLHGVLVTLAAVSPGEWDILVSGRFDGFLWSGAETMPGDGSAFPSRGPSRGPTPGPRMMTPFGMRSMTPAPLGAGAPVQMDEETEIAVLAEVEREIFLGMEALEDAFEALHHQAEQVRMALRERSAGLSMAAQARKGSSADVEARLGTPASCLGMDDDEGGWDVQSTFSLAPDDSASNVGFKHRKKRREGRERQTPAPVEEEDEEVVFVEPNHHPRRSGKKRS